MENRFYLADRVGKQYLPEVMSENNFESIAITSVQALIVKRKDI